MLDTLSLAVGIAALAVIVWGVLLGGGELIQYEYYRLRSIPTRLNLNEIRHIVASYLLLGLEFLIAADIMRTVAGPTLEELAVLGGLVVIRTVISFFLGQEISEIRPTPHERIAKGTGKEKKPF
ncbi:DUF1622 domain-containing protein [Dehalogenimonas sp. THU2]|uniref:DUF1622 domain-containing protein n=1 Tax=Dehalogenimonas sp. THU2 TaxID=3151121 RepID=UPI00321853F1